MTTPPVDPDPFNAFEAAGWHQLADGYWRFFGPIAARAIEPLLDAAAVGAGKRVLDAATGPGHVAAVCARRGANVIGVDVAPGMVVLARELHPGVEFVEGDAERLSFGDGSFDAVVAGFMIHHVGRPEKVAAELARVLAPGGRLALSTWDAPDRQRLTGAFVDATTEAGAPPPPELPPGPPIFRFADGNEFARLLSGAGLVDVEVQTVAFGHRVASADEWWEGVLDGAVRMRALVLGQPHEMQARIRAAFDELVSRHATADGLEIPVSVKLASGRKPATS